MSLKGRKQEINYGRRIRHENILHLVGGVVVLIKQKAIVIVKNQSFQLYLPNNPFY